MGCRIIRGKEDGSDQHVAVLFDSITGTAFGPVFSPPEHAEVFREWLASRAIDPRGLSDSSLKSEHKRFMQALADMQRVIEDAHRPAITLSEDGIRVELYGNLFVYLTSIGSRHWVERVTQVVEGGTINIDSESAGEISFSNVEALVEDLRKEWQGLPQ